MSLRRLSRSCFVDPWTGMEVDTANLPPLPVTEPAPVVRRRATPEELARLDGDRPRQIPAWPTPAELAAVRASREAARLAKAAAAAAMVRAEREARRAARQAERDAHRAVRGLPRQPRPRHRSVQRQAVSDAGVLSALRQTRGNLKAASRVAGITPQSIRQRLGVLRRWGLLPEDVASMVDGRRHGR